MSDGDNKSLTPAIHRVPLDKLTIFEVTESELESLERGSPESIYLNLSISVISIAVSFSIALATTNIISIRTFCFFVIVTVVGYLAALTFGLLWLQSPLLLFLIRNQSRLAAGAAAGGPLRPR